ncbi:unnamed protein product [Urochloa decumbens]|uniref:malate dehydrogenase n=1 Tax=Urochloa decumbens TaxID=240449 RepID=A0ABC9FA87_9POAL
MAAASIATLSFASVPCRKHQLRHGASAFIAQHFTAISSSSSHWHCASLKSGAPRLPHAAKRVIVAQAGAGRYKVAILGAAGGVGQPLSLLIKMSPLVSALHLYDISDDVSAVAADLSNCNTPAQVAGFTGRDELAGSLAGADLVVITAGTTAADEDDDVFIANADIVRELAEAVAEHAPPGALVHVITGPVDSTVPVAAEAMKRKGGGAGAYVYDPRKLFGALPLADVDVPVVGGGACATALPLLSKARPRAAFTEEEVEELTARVRGAGAEVAEAKAGANGSSATLSAAYAAARFVEASLRGLDGDGGVYECAYVQSQVVPELPFFACRVKLGREGVEELVGEELRGISEYEARALEALKPLLKASIDKGVAYVQQQQEAALN